MQSRKSYEILPRPDRVHHMVEDFLAQWDAPKSHILPLRRFIENIIDADLRNFFAEDCLKMAMVFDKVPKTCNELYMNGISVQGTDELLYQAYKAGLTI